MLRILLSFTVVFIASSYGAFAGHCNDADDAFCQNVSNAEEYAACMGSNISKLSANCQTVIKVYNSCLSDISQHCKSADSEHATLGCLKDNEKSLSSVCKSSLSGI